MKFESKYLLLFIWAILLASNPSVAKLKVSHLAIPENVGLDIYPSFENEKVVDRRPASASVPVPDLKVIKKINFSISAACTQPNGIPVLYNDKGYGECVTESSSTKRIILDRPTKSLYMGIHFRP